MKKMNKKGFTIVELVIVVTVIAILSAVLIPTFAGIIKRSKQSSDEQAVRNMNTVLATIIDDEIDYNDIAEALDEAGYNVLNKEDAWNPSYKKHTAYWIAEKNTIVLVEEGQIVYPASLAGEFDASKATPLKASSYFKQSTATTAEAAVADIKAAIKNGTSVTLTTKMEAPIAVEEALMVRDEEALTVNLGGNSLEATVEKQNASGQDVRPYAFKVEKGGELTLANGTMSARGVMNNGTLSIGSDVTIVATDDDGGAAIKNKKGATLTIDGATLKTTGGDGTFVDEDEIYYEPQVVSNEGGTIVIKNATIINEGSANYAVSNMSGTMEISNTTITSKRGGIHVTTGKVTINNCTVTSSWTSSAHALFVAGGEVTVDGGTFSVPAESNGCWGIYKAAGTVTLKNSPVGTTYGI